jgi:predicted TIM-barrel fold metal-dependent hydrolase
MLEIARLTGGSDRFELGFLKREATPAPARKLGIRLVLARLSLSDTISIHDRLGVERCRSTVHNWLQKAYLQPLGGADPDHVAVDVTVIQLNAERVADALSRACNDFVAAEFLDEGDEGFKAAITLSPLAPHRAAEEIDRDADHPDMVAAIIGSTGIFPPLGDRRLDPIFEALSDKDLPLVCHGATGSFISAHPFIKRGLISYWELHIVSHPFNQMPQMTSRIGQGVPERFPDVDIVMQEAGVGWIPFTMYRMDNEYGKRRSAVPLLERRPSEYVEDQFYFTSQSMAEPENTQYLEWMIRMFDGQSNLMCSTADPHYDFDRPEELY